MSEKNEYFEKETLLAKLNTELKEDKKYTKKEIEDVVNMTGTVTPGIGWNPVSMENGKYKGFLPIQNGVVLVTTNDNRVRPTIFDVEIGEFHEYENVKAWVEMPLPYEG